MEFKEYLTTEYQWDDLILNQYALQQLAELKKCAEEQHTCHALFYGPAGTGKTMAGALLGKQLKKEVVRIDLSIVVSKYIGETEKNLSQLFDAAENKSWILFFDEADALFGKRTNVKDAHDKYANQEISYLLQRIHDYNGVLILATNNKNNIDDAFLRRLRYVIQFPVPEPPERLRLWEKALANKNIKANIDLHPIASQAELTGGSIINVVKQIDQQTDLRNSDALLQKINAVIRTSKV